MAVDFVSLFQESGRLVRQRKSYWVLGGLLGLGNLLSTIARVLLRPWYSGIFARQDDWLAVLAGEPIDSFPSLEPTFIEQFSVTVVGGALGLLLFFLPVWLVATWADATLITAVSHPTTYPLRRSMRTGFRLLGRFIGIDALVFFPWFVLALVIMLLFAAVVIGSGVLSLQGQEETAVPLLLVGLACILPLTCLLIPVSYAAVIYRLLAFRDAALQAHSARQAIQHTWRVVRRQSGNVLLLVMLMSGGVGAINLVLNGATLPLAALMSVPQRAGIATFPGIAAILFLSLGLLLILTLKAILHALAAAVWTVAYQHLLAHEE